MHLQIENTQSHTPDRKTHVDVDISNGRSCRCRARRTARRFRGCANNRAVLATPDAPAVRVVARGGKGSGITMAGIQKVVADVRTSDGTDCPC